MIIGHSVYDKFKSRELITILNKALVSVSYNEVIRRRQMKAYYAVQATENARVLFLSHFSPHCLTIGALDNFDHDDRSSLSGRNSSHDTVSVLFQITSEIKPSKPLVLKMSVI